ncbi:MULTISPECIES: hypothetical protein [Reichenbachiella]|uniref:Uncharacterized protein n=1 Tax=Reichenbachiella agariperforans TaxID=156994 RepID=A0A1M6NSN8_REIAG|nr:MULTISPECIES: hypothetical protein [Reichenbachiella]MBU2916021.1 hypothetical protein [Reichenbachiella agariperforans]SHJ98709.1 hypothetical protein SAMN04488028_102390 [Reichenbachiella agariperforans]
MNNLMKTTIVAFFVLFAFAGYSQKLKVTSGKLKALSAYKSYNMEYTYHEDLKIGKKSEEEYLSEKQTDKNEKEAGSGDAWVAAWHENKEGGKFFEKFETLFNDVLSGDGVTASRDNEGADCTLKLEVYFLDPGYHIGISSKPAYVSMTATFVADGQEIAVVDLSKAPGQGAGGYDFDAAYRISESFAKTGKTLGKELSKQAY